MEQDRILQTLQQLLQQTEAEVRNAHHEAIVARQIYVDTQNTYKDLKLLYDERLGNGESTDA